MFRGMTWFRGTTWRLAIALLPQLVYGAEHEAPTGIVLMMADDLGWGDVGYHGHPIIKTPNLDAMAANGLQFSRFYAAAPVCSPTRGSCLTGRHPYRYGIETANDGHLKQQEVCLAEVLREQGYATGHFGKWHLGTLSPDFSGKGLKRDPAANFMTPGTAGFDEWFSTEYAVATWDPYDPENAHGNSDRRALYWHNGRAITDGVSEGLIGGDSRIIMDKAIPFIEASVRRKTPFFAVVWFHAPHAPVIGGQEYRAMYPDVNEERQHYFATSTELDEQVGRLREKLRELGVAENTMLWFCSDNGPEGNPGPRGRSQGSAGPFRGRKRSLYEGGIRVPGVLEWPARIVAGRKTDIPAVTSDIFPTIIDALGKETAEIADRPYDGLSLMQLIKGEMASRPVPIAFQSHGFSTLSGNRYKLVHNSTGKRARSDNGQTPIAEWECYDLLNDPGETRNIARDHAAQVARMREQLKWWRESCAESAQGADY